MNDRYRVLFGAGVLAGGMSAAVLAGAGVAAAEDGSSSDSSARSATDAGPRSTAGSGTSSERAGDAQTDGSSDRGEFREASTRADRSESRAERAAARAERVEERRALLVRLEDHEDETEAEDEVTPDVQSPVEVDVPAPDDTGVVAGDEATDTTPAPGGEPAPASAPVSPTEPVPSSKQSADAEDHPPASTYVQSMETDLGAQEAASVMKAAAVENPWLGVADDLVKAFNVLNDIATAAYNLYTRTMEFFAGPLRAPFGSWVRAEKSSLVLGDGVEVRADWYFPPGFKAPTGLIYFQHGFLATGSFYSATAAYLAEKTNSIVVVPTLTWNPLDVENYPLMLPHTYRAIADLFTGDRAALKASAKLAGFGGRLPERVVFAGHSAGGGTAVGAAGYLVERGGADDLAGVVMLDGAAFFGTLAASLAKIPTSIPVYNLAAEPDNWNIYGEASFYLAQARPDAFTGIQVSGGKHSDGMQSASPTVQFLTYLATGFSRPWTVATSELMASGWINDMLKGTHTAKYYGEPGSSLDILIGWWRQSVEVLSVDTVPLSALHQVIACLFSPGAPACEGLPDPLAGLASRGRPVLV